MKLPDPYADRTYRVLHTARDLTYFRVTEGETDLHIGARRELTQKARACVLDVRAQIRGEIELRPEFLSSLVPIAPSGGEPKIVLSMLEAGKLAGVGPMAAVAGAVAEYVGSALMKHSDEVIVENGGDIFLCGKRERIVAVHAGKSPLSGALGIRVLPEGGLGVCTSSATVGHSLSFGHSDAAVTVSRDAALADAAATALGNMVHRAEDIEKALETIMAIEGILGALVIIGDRLGAIGQIELTAL